MDTQVHSYNTKDKAEKHTHLQQFFNKKVTYMSAKLLKHIPIAIKNELCLDLFKTKLKEYLGDKEVYFN